MSAVKNPRCSLQFNQLCMCDWLLACVVGWLVDWLIYWLVGWLIDWLIDWLTGLTPWWRLWTLYSSHARWSCLRRLRSLLLCACSVRDVNCSSAITSRFLLTGLSSDCILLISCMDRLPAFFFFFFFLVLFDVCSHKIDDDECVCYVSQGVNDRQMISWLLVYTDMHTYIYIYI